MLARYIDQLMAHGAYMLPGDEALLYSSISDGTGKAISALRHKDNEMFMNSMDISKEKRRLDEAEKELDKKSAQIDSQEAAAKSDPALEEMAAQMLKQNPKARLMLLKTAQPVKQEGDFTIDSNGDFGATRGDHLKKHISGKFSDVIDSIDRELQTRFKGRIILWNEAERGKAARGDWRIRHDIDELGEVDAVTGRKTIYTEHGSISVDPATNILVIIDDRFEADHAGRNRYCVYARNEAKAQHEISELYSWFLFAKENRIIDVVGDRDIGLGEALRKWMNHPTEGDWRAVVIRQKRLRSSIKRRYWRKKERRSGGI